MRTLPGYLSNLRVAPLQFGWVLESKVEHLENPETQSLKNSR